MFPYTEKYKESESDIQDNNLLYTIHQHCQNTFQKPNTGHFSNKSNNFEKSILYFIFLYKWYNSYFVKKLVFRKCYNFSIFDSGFMKSSLTQPFPKSNPFAWRNARSVLNSPPPLGTACVRPHLRSSKLQIQTSFGSASASSQISFKTTRIQTFSIGGLEGRSLFRSPVEYW